MRDEARDGDGRGLVHESDLGYLSDERQRRHFGEEWVREEEGCSVVADSKQLQEFKSKCTGAGWWALGSEYGT